MKLEENLQYIKNGTVFGPIDAGITIISYLRLEFVPSVIVFLRSRSIA